MSQVSDSGDEDRIVREILDDVDVYEEGEGPEGPWYFKSLTVTRRMNAINIEDVDGKPFDRIGVPDLSDHPDPHQALKDELNRINEESLDEL